MSLASESELGAMVPRLPLATAMGEVLRLPPVSPALEDPCAPLRALLQQYMTPEEVVRAREAYELAATAHGAQTRRSGEPYIHHPVAVACILAELQLDVFTIQAALLHDVIEDCNISKENIIERFGPEVAEMVDGVSKLGQVRFETREEAQAENFRKMFLAMSRDIRVVLIKLADRLHNMRTMGVMKPEKRRRISRETLDIYAPIAQRLGIHAIRIELEEMAFSHLYPKRWHTLNEAVKAARGNRKEAVQKIEHALEDRLRQEGFAAQVSGREKHAEITFEKLQIGQTIGRRRTGGHHCLQHRATGLGRHLHNGTHQLPDGTLSHFAGDVGGGIQITAHQAIALTQRAHTHGAIQVLIQTGRTENPGGLLPVTLQNGLAFLAKNLQQFCIIFQTFHASSVIVATPFTARRT